MKERMFPFVNTRLIYIFNTAISAFFFLGDTAALTFPSLPYHTPPRASLAESCRDNGIP